MSASFPHTQWDALPFDAVVALVAAVQSALPHHQAEFALAALRSVSRHWRAAVDDARTRWQADAEAQQTNEQSLLSNLSRWRNLRHLELAHFQLSDRVLQALAGCRRLRSVTLCFCEASGRVFEAVGRLPDLQHFSFSPSHQLFMGSIGPAPLAACTALTSLELSGFHAQDIAPDVVSVLRGASRLQHLALARTVRAVAAQAQQSFDIGFAKQLTSLELSSSFTVDDAFLQLFEQLTNLRRINLSGSRNLTDAGIRGISCLSASLTALVLEGGHQVTADGATVLATLTNLRSLALGYSNRMSSDSLLPLIAGALWQLTHLDIRGCRRACAPQAFDHLSRLKHLQQLSAMGCRLPQTAAATLAHMTALQLLDVDYNPTLAGPGLTVLSRTLRDLRCLHVSECGLEDPHIVPLLASLPQLRTVVLSDNRQLTGAVLEALAAGPACTSLQVLKATELQLPNEVLTQLLPQLAALQLLDISGNQHPVDPLALLAAGQAAPSLHTLRVPGVKATRAPTWLQVVQQNPARRRLLRIESWDVFAEAWD